MQVARLDIENTTAPNNVISLQILFAESVEMLVTWREIAPTDSEVLTQEMLYLAVHLNEELAQETLWIEKWKTSCKNCPVHQPTADQLAISKVVKVVTTQLDTVLHPKILGIDQLQLLVPLLGHANVKNVVDTNKLHHGNNHEETMATTLMHRQEEVPLLGNNRLLHRHHLKTMAMAVTNKVMVKMVTRLHLLHLRQLD